MRETNKGLYRMRQAERPAAGLGETELYHTRAAAGGALRRSGAGADLLWWHISFFLVIGTGACLAALIRDPSRLTVPGWVLLWCGIILLHLTIVALSGVVFGAVRRQARAAAPAESPAGVTASGTARSLGAASVTMQTAAPSPETSGPGEPHQAWQRSAVSTIRQFPTLLAGSRHQTANEASATDNGSRGMTLEEARRLATGEESAWRRWLRRAPEPPRSDGAPLTAERETPSGAGSTWPTSARSNGQAQAEGWASRAKSSPQSGSPWPSVRRTDAPPAQTATGAQRSPGDTADDLPSLSSAFAASAGSASTGSVPPAANGQRPEGSRDPVKQNGHKDRPIDPTATATAQSLLAAFGLNDRLAPVGPDDDPARAPSDAAEPQRPASQTVAPERDVAAGDKRDHAPKGQESAS